MRTVFLRAKVYDLIKVELPSPEELPCTQLLLSHIQTCFLTHSWTIRANLVWYCQDSSLAPFSLKGFVSGACLPNTSLLNEITQHHYLPPFQVTLPPYLSTKRRKHLKRSLSNKAGPLTSECVGPLVPASPRQPVPRSERAAASPEH